MALMSQVVQRGFVRTILAADSYQTAAQQPQASGKAPGLVHEVPGVAAHVGCAVTAQHEVALVHAHKVADIDWRCIIDALKGTPAGPREPVIGAAKSASRPGATKSSRAVAVYWILVAADSQQTGFGGRAKDARYRAHGEKLLADNLRKPRATLSQSPGGCRCSFAKPKCAKLC